MKIKIRDTFEECKKFINSHSEQSWRLKQIVVPLNEKTDVYGAWCYQIVLKENYKSTLQITIYRGWKDE